MDQRILKQVKQLPPLPQSIIDIELIYQDQNSSFNDMAKVLEKDPMLTANLLKMANSPLYGFSREIQNVAQAVSLFGMGTIRGFALATIVKKGFKIELKPYGITESQFSELSKRQNTLAFRWFRKLNPKALNQLSPAAFLVELGKLIISKELIESNTKDIFKDVDKTYKAITEVERINLQMTTAEVSSIIFDHWKFESSIVDIIKHSDNPDNADGNIKQLSAALYIIRQSVDFDGQVTKSNLENAKVLLNKYGFEQKLFLDAIQTLL